MMHEIGNAGLIVGAIAGASGVCMGVIAARAGSDIWAQRARVAAACMMGGLALSLGTLLWALWKNDLALAYVGNHSSADTPSEYRLAAAWSGSAGSLLLLTTIAAGVSAVIAARVARAPAHRAGCTMSVLCGVSGMLALMVLLADNPFEVATRTLAGSGHGLDFRLRHWAMIVHPPLIMLGYGACIGAMSMALGASRDQDAKTMRGIRAWSMLAWASLGCGMLLGARWAYTQLGWGGYWNWDPVENASLVPLLLCTGAVHSLRLDAGRRRLSTTTLVFLTLASATGLLGGWITRSGSIASVHAFARSGSAVWVLVLGTCVALVGLWRSTQITAGLDHKRAGHAPALWEQTIVWSHVLLIAAALGTLAGTLAPVLTGWSGERAVGVTSTYYQRFVVVPLLGAMVLMVVGVVSARALAIAPRRDSAPLSTLGVRSAGVLLAHMGILVLSLGVAASSLLGITMDVTLAKGEHTTVGAFTLTYADTRQFPGPGCEVVEARISITAHGGEAHTMTPQRRFDARDPLNAASEGALRMGLVTDLFVSLVGWDAGGERAALHVRVLPMASWIWIGGGMCMLGLLAGLALPADRRRAAPEHSMADSTTLAPPAAREGATA